MQLTNEMPRIAPGPLPGTPLIPGRECNERTRNLEIPGLCLRRILRCAIAHRGMTVLSIPVMIRLERALLADPDILRLVGPKFCQLDADLGEMQPRPLLVQRLRQHIDLLLVLAILVVGEQLDLR